VLLCFVVGLDGLVFYNTPVGTFSCLTIVFRPQEEYGNYNVNSLFKNYSLVYGFGNACVPSPGGLKSQMLKVTNNFPCFQGQQIEVGMSNGFGALFNTANFGDYSSQGSGHWDFPPLAIPYVYAGSDYTQPIGTYVSCQSPLSKNPPNVTVFLDYTTISGIAVDFRTGVGYRLMWVGYTMGWLVMVVATVKFTLMVFTEGKIQFSIPQIVVCFCFFCGFFCVILAFLQLFGVVGFVNRRAGIFFEVWPFVCTLSGLLVLGLYYREVASLSKSGGGTLSVLKWPCIITLCILWAAVITNSFLQAFPTFGATQGYGSFVQFQMSILCLASFVIVVSFCWGAISLLRSVDSSSPVFRSVAFIICLTGGALVITVFSVLLEVATSYFIGGTGGPLGASISIQQWHYLLECLVFFLSDHFCSDALLGFPCVCVKGNRALEIGHFFD